MRAVYLEVGRSKVVACSVEWPARDAGRRIAWHVIDRAWGPEDETA